MCLSRRISGWRSFRTRSPLITGWPVLPSERATISGGQKKREELPVSTLTEEHHRWIEHALAARSDDQFRDHARKQEAAEILEWALRQLSPENRAVLTLVHLDGHSVREAAHLLGWSVVNVKVRAHRARRALRKILSATSRGST